MVTYAQNQTKYRRGEKRKLIHFQCPLFVSFCANIDASISGNSFPFGQTYSFSDKTGRHFKKRIWFWIYFPSSEMIFFLYLVIHFCQHHTDLLIQVITKRKTKEYTRHKSFPVVDAPSFLRRAHEPVNTLNRAAVKAIAEICNHDPLPPFLL